MFGDGSIRLDWTGVGGRAGLTPQLVLEGKLVARGYGVGAVVEIGAQVTAWDISSVYALIGLATPKHSVLN